MPRHTLGSLLIAGCALCWGLIGIIVREVDLPAMAIVFWRVALAAAAVAAIVAVAGRRDLLALRGDRSALALGALLALHWSLYFAAIKETSVASAVLVTYAAPIFMALLAPVLLRERVPRVSIAALAVSAAGIAAITLAGGDGDGVRAGGIVLALLAAITYAFLIVLVKRWAAGVDPITFVVYQSATAAVLLSPAAVVAGLSLSGAEIGYLVALGVGLTGVTGVVYIGALRRVPATTAGILAYMEPVSAAVLAAVLLGEGLTAGVVAGGLAIVAAGVAVVLRSPEPLAASVEEPGAAASAAASAGVPARR